MKTKREARSVVTYLRLPASLDKILEERAAKSQRTKSAEMVWIIQQWLDKHAYLLETVKE